MTTTKASLNRHDGSAALSWVAAQLRFERLLRTLEQETTDGPANPSGDAQ
jgi:hypothetical protein